MVCTRNLCAVGRSRTALPPSDPSYLLQKWRHTFIRTRTLLALCLVFFIFALIFSFRGPEEGAYLKLRSAYCLDLDMGISDYYLRAYESQFT